MPIDKAELDEIVEIKPIFQRLESGKAYSFEEIFEMFYERKLSEKPSFDDAKNRSEEWGILISHFNLLAVDAAVLIAKISRESEQGKMIQGIKDDIDYFFRAD